MSFSIRRVVVRILLTAFLVAALTSVSATALAQDADPVPPGASPIATPDQLAPPIPPPSPRPWGQLRFGKLWLTPGVSLKEFGIDTNVFNSNAAADPKSDLYAIAGPDLTALFDSKRARVEGVLGVDYVYYVKSESERSFQSSASVDGRFRVSKRIELTAGANQGSTRQRFSPEVDLRARQWTRSLSLGTSIGLSSRSWLDLRASSSTRRFDDGAIYNAVPLQLTLDEDVRASGASFRYGLTPWTQVSFGGEASAHRFPRMPMRDADSVRYFLRADVNARALIFGVAEGGYRYYTTRFTGIEDYEGPVGNAMVGTRLGENTLLQLVFFRDVALSYQPRVPFMLSRNLGVIAQRTLFSRASLVLEAHGRRWIYKGFVPAFPEQVPPPNERVEDYIARIIVRVRGELRLGFTAEYLKRYTDAFVRQYEGLRFWTSIHYGRFSVRDRSVAAP